MRFQFPLNLDDRDNLGKPPSQPQKRAAKRFLNTIDRDNWEVDYEIAVLTRIRKSNGRNGSSE